MSLNKAKNVAQKTVSVGLTATTSLWMMGASFFVAAPAAHALDNEAVVTDVTGDNPRIASDGESERVFLGINAARVDNTDTIVLDAVRVGLIGTEDEASNIEEVRLYSDSSLAGTNGVFDENDSQIDSVSRTEAGGAETTVSTLQTAGNEDDLDLTAVAGLVAGDAIKIGIGASAEIREVATVVTNDTAAGDACAAAAGANECVTLTADTGSLRTATTAVRELADMETANTEGFQAYAGGEVTVEVGDFDDAAASVGYNIPKTDSGSEAGDDVFVVLVTADGADGQTIEAQVFTNDIQYRDTSNNLDITANVSTGTGTTNGTSKEVTFGGDGDAPSITKVETYDNNKNGRVDRVKVYFSESMADTETGTENFVDALGGNTGQINSVGSGATADIDLAATGTWMTTTVLNDTFQIDFASDADDDVEGGDDGYSNANRSTGDTWTVIYDEDGAADVMKDATGENLLDESVQTTDKARPEMLLAELKDNDGDDAVDSLEVTWSEKLGASSDSAGYTLTNTTENPDVDYTLGSVTSMKKSDGADANTNDTLVIAVTEKSDDIEDTFQLDYTASATTTDSAGNEGQSETNLAVTVGVEPRIDKVEYQDTDSNGQIDRAVITYTRAVDTDAGWEDDFALSGGYTVDAAATSDLDDTAVHNLGINESGSADTHKTPELTYTKPANIDVCLDGGGGDDDCDGASETALENVAAGDVTEEDDAPPVLLTATFYEADSDLIWENGDTLQFLFSENIDAGQVATGWNQSGATGSVFTDWQLDVNAGNPGAVLADNQVPDSGTISVTGRVVNVQATADATAALAANDEVSLVANEIKDAAGNSAVVDETANEAGSGPLNDLDIETDPAAPVPTANVESRDVDGDGVLDAVEVEFGGMIDASTLDMNEWAAARGSNDFAGSNVTPDLTVTSVTTVSGGDDTRVLVSFNEANEGTDALPMVKYVQGGTMMDLAGNEIADFNHNTSDDTEFEQGITYPTVDGADPQVVLKRLRDRNSNGMYDQLVLVFSEDMDTTSTSSDGWDVSDHTLSSAGAWSGNDGTYDAYTFVSTQNVFKVDILESAAPTMLPGVMYTSTGLFKDDAGFILSDVAAGGEESPDISVFAPAPNMVDDGELFMLSGDSSVWIAKHVNGKKFRRHVLWGDFDTIYPHLAPMWPVQTVDQATYDMYGLSAWIRVVGTAPVYEVNDDATAHWITCDDDPVDGQDCANEWLAAGGDPDGIFEINGAGGEWDRLTVSNPVILPDVAN